MKISSVEREVSTQGVIKQNAFTIKASAKAFDILANGLYSDKVAAIVRELICNAVDSHVAANKKDLPIEIHMPNTLEPWFGVRDYGIGLSNEDVEGLYTTLFDSTKSDSNDFIGALGLGSKSPFSYTDSFTVISRFNGFKSTYSAFKDDQKIPNIALLHKEETAEGNGLEVQVPFGRYDFNSLESKVAAFICRINPTPTILGNSNFCSVLSATPRSIIIEGKGWRVINNTKGNKPLAVQGIVAYPISENKMEDLLDHHRSILTSYANIFEIDFDIGDLEVAASREELGYDPRTISNIKKRLQEVAVDFERVVNERVAEANTKWAAICELVKLKDLNSDLFRQISFSWKGEKIPGSLDVTIPYKKIKEESPTLELFSIDGHKIKKIARIESVSNDLNFEGMLTVSPKYTRYQFVIVDDEKERLWRGKVKTHACNLKRTGSTTSLFIIKAQKKKDIKTILNYLGNPETIKTSELDAPEKVVRVKNKPKVFKYTLNRYDHWEEIEFDSSIKEKRFYINFRNNQWIDGSGESRKWSSCTGCVSAVVDAVTKIVKDPTSGNEIKEIPAIYGLNKVTYGTVSKLDPKIKCLFEHVWEEHVKKFKGGEEELIQRLVDMDARGNDYSNPHIIRWLRYESDKVALISKVAVNSPILESLERIKTLFNVGPNKLSDELIKGFIRQFPNKFKGIKPKDTVNSILESIMQSYPMVRYLDCHSSDVSVAMIDYINMVDSLRK
jgi:hypothetical protein